MEVGLTFSPDRDRGRYIIGEDVNITCNATNPPGVERPLTFTWMKVYARDDTITVTTGSLPGVTVTTGEDYSTLLFRSIQPDYRIEGLYLCRVFNRLEKDSVDVETNITVLSKMCVSMCVRCCHSFFVLICQLLQMWCLEDPMVLELLCILLQ